MGRKRRLELTRVRADGRPKWRKVYHGKMYTFRGEYDDAVKIWHRTLVELEADPPQDEPHESDGRTDGRSWRSRSSEARAVGPERTRATEEPLTTRRTIAGAVDSFLVRQRARVSAGQISAGWYDCLQRCVKHFVGFVGGRFGVNHINGAVLEAYHTLVMVKVGNGWSPEYAQTYMSAAKQFVRWLDHNEFIERLPRNINSNDLRITITPHKVRTFAVEEIKTLLAHAPDRTRLFLLLMLNIGATQKDISDLRPDELDWTKGRIIRKRSKTRNGGSVPTIEYPLWWETFDLLRKYGERQGERVLRNEDGGALKVEELRDGNRPPVPKDIGWYGITACARPSWMPWPVVGGSSGP